MASGYPDFEGGKRRVYNTADWATDVGLAKAFNAFANNQAWNGVASLIYVVPPGKTLYIMGAATKSMASAAADAELNQMCELIIEDLPSGDDLWWQGGNGGVGQSFTQPIKYDAGHSFILIARNKANHNCNIQVTALGYEV